MALAALRSAELIRTLRELAGLSRAQRQQRLAQLSESAFSQNIAPTLLHIKCGGTHHTQCVAAPRRELDDPRTGVGGVRPSNDIVVPFQGGHRLSHRLPADPEPVSQI